MNGDAGILLLGVQRAVIPMSFDGYVRICNAVLRFERTKHILEGKTQGQQGHAAAIRLRCGCQCPTWWRRKHEGSARLAQIRSESERRGYLLRLKPWSGHERTPVRVSANETTRQRT